VTAPARVALVGLGEAGSAITADLVAAGADVRGYDPKAAVPDGVAARTDEADAVRDADLVLSVNSSHDAVPALVNALPALRAGTVWADLNTASPRVKAGVAAREHHAELAGSDEQTIDRLVDGTHRHARRRVEEMTAAAKQVTELGLRSRIAAARDQLIDLSDRDTG
jgi:3-hydroxyisobutyrate dehydrogenase-like beta-hydroxyacid dehydrogenase